MTPDRFVLPVAVTLLALAVAAFASGCGASNPEEFRQYSEIETDAGTAVAAADKVPRDPEPMPAQSDGASAGVDSAVAAETASPPADAGVSGGTTPVDLPNPNEVGLSPGAVNGDTPPAGVEPAVALNTTPGETLDSVKPVPAETGNAVAAAPSVTPDAPPRPRQVEVLIKSRDFVVEGPQDAIRVSYDDIDLLKVLNMDPVTPDAPALMPQWLKDLDGRRIRIRGFMFPPFMETGLERFALARDNQICCFGRDPKIYDLFQVQMRAGKTANYIENRPFDVVGIFHIDPLADAEGLFQLYRIDDAIVIEK